MILATTLEWTELLGPVKKKFCQRSQDEKADFKNILLEAKKNKDKKHRETL